MVPLADEAAAKRISALCAELHEERFLAREGYRLAMRGLLALIAIAVARLAASRARTGSVTLAPADGDRRDACAGWWRRISAKSGCSISMPTSSP